MGFAGELGFLLFRSFGFLADLRDNSSLRELRTCTLSLIIRISLSLTIR
jgi:hypothetical protein